MKIISEIIQLKNLVITTGIIEILIADEKDIEQLTLVEIESKKKSIPEIIEDIDVNYDIRRYRWETYFNKETPKSSKPERIVFKAISDNRIIGYIAGHLTSRFEKDAEIQSFYILKEYQRKGIGQELLGKFVEWIRQHSATSLCVGIAFENDYQNFYLKYGGLHLNKHWIYWDDLNLLIKKLIK